MVIAAALINRRAVVEHLIQHQPQIVWIVASGWEGSFSLEDTVCAGAIAALLSEELGIALVDLAGNDEVAGAIALYHQWQHALLDLFHLASHGQRLLRLNNQEDLVYCSKLDQLDIVPIQQEPGVLVSNQQLATVAS
jgi:2-phosphosulfolactate phosphatase